ncbi:hypothetical protein D1BOALGB6SA_4458 [Olavius sp. associated proteobacterium Delta 1]|nr:hypothetical protein D1BOALGB6SA_4458 [Olavius sp. associated proteobacterium Delta 1]
MVFQMPQYWDVTIDGTQIILCLLILLFLIRSRKKSRDSAQDKAIRDSGQSFNVQIFSQTLKQQVDQAFANIAETIAVEQRNLDKVLPINDHGSQAYGISQYPSGLHRPVAQEIAPIASDASGSGQLHEQIQKLALKGMSARQISEELETPLGEVELVLSLHTSAGD